MGYNSTAGVDVVKIQTVFSTLNNNRSSEVQLKEAVDHYLIFTEKEKNYFIKERVSGNQTFIDKVNKFLDENGYEYRF